ncbi:MAG TPA: hypothetical protein VK773_05160 [Acidimicrobiales bacterium]|jgi:hypothetical protein|nr:hypothetical protein [Acidimicrobiales bacterium]
MPRHSFRKELADLLGGLDGWRLEARTTPGASPLWCFLSDGKIEYSVSVEGKAVVLYVMDTDEEMTFPDSNALRAWLSEHRPDAVRQAQPRPEIKKRARGFFEWD